MEHLWAPWRHTYIQNEQKDISRLFYDIGMSNDDKANHVIYRSKSCYAVLNRYPYNTGHLMVIPYRPVTDLGELGPDELHNLWDTVQAMSVLIKKILTPHGLNIGINLGIAAGAGVPNHLHVHIVPRWTGDTNFMSTTSHTRVHPADLDKVYELLTEALK
jgi:ATP adenylyltransferase